MTSSFPGIAVAQEGDPAGIEARHRFQCVHALAPCLELCPARSDAEALLLVLLVEVDDPVGAVEGQGAEEGLPEDTEHRAVGPQGDGESDHHQGGEARPVAEGPVGGSQIVEE